MLKILIQKIKTILNKNAVLKNAFSIFYLQTIASIIAFINTYLLLKAIGVSGVGTIVILTTYVNFYIGVFSFQSYSAIIKFGQEAIEANDLLRLKGYFKNAFLQDILSSMVTLLIAYLCIEATSKYFDIDSQTKKYISIYLVLIPFSVFRSLSAVLRLNNDYKSEPLIAIITALVKTIILSLGLHYSFSIEYYIISEVIITVINSLLMMIFGRRCLSIMGCLDFLKVKLNRSKEFTYFNVYNNISSTLDLPTGQLTNLIINKLLGVEAVGIFNIVSKFGNVINQAISPVTQSLYPELSKMVAKKKIHLAFSVVRKTFVVLFSSGIVIATLSFFTYKLWLYNFITATPYNGFLLSIYFVYIGVAGAVAGIHLLFLSLNLVKYNIPLVIICNSIYILALWLFTGWFGLTGAVLALITQALLIVSIKYFIIKNKTKEAYLSNV